MSKGELFSEQMSLWEVHVADRAYETLQEYARLLAAYEKANVIGERSPERIFEEHIVDSLACLLFKPLRHTKNLLDVGSGGGLPGIPLKIVCPTVTLTLLEATQKKTEFLEYAVRRISLSGISVLRGRAETLGREGVYRGSFQMVSARAVAPLPVLLEYCVPFLREGGCVIAMKARRYADEVEAGIRAAKQLGAELLEEIRVPFIDEFSGKERRLFVFRKVGDTPDAYPRREGLPAKRPLGAG